MDTIEYKGYRGSVRFSAEDRVFYGEITGIDDLVNFEGADVDDLERAFHQAVDDYVALCEKVGKKPERSYSGNIPLRIPSDLHRRVAKAAEAEATSVNSWIAAALQEVTASIGPVTTPKWYSIPPKAKGGFKRIGSKRKPKTRTKRSARS